MSARHIPRRSGSFGTDRDLGARQVVPPAEVPIRRRRPTPRGPELCGAPHPDLDLTCTGESHIEEAATGAVLSSLMGLPAEPVKVIHRGKHRARPLAGVLIRWTDAEVPA
jgi:hypothetical protein